MLHLLGGIVGYALPRLTGCGDASGRTLSIETATKSSAFGFLLAKLHFGEYAACVPSAVSLIGMAFTGSVLAMIRSYVPLETRGRLDRSLDVDCFPRSHSRQGQTLILFLIAAHFL